MGTKKSVPQFRFRKNDSVGAAGAEDDADFLRECFVDNGDLEILQDVGDRRQVVVGRTGAGKSALLLQLKEERPDYVIELDPENLALTYISNSTILRFFADLGVNLDPFFKLLWRHVLTLEVLERYFKDHPDRRTPSWWDRLMSMFSGDSKSHKSAREALNYLESWGSQFWIETDNKIKEITRHVEKELVAKGSAAVGVDIAKLEASGEERSKLGETQKRELKNRGQEVIAKAQIQDLSKVIALLDAVLSDKQKPYIVVIDGLDDQWVEERLRYKLIMQLIVTARDFGRVSNAKVAISMRLDLLERTFRVSREAGFQLEKYESLYIRMTWTKAKLLEVLDKRVDHLVKRRYTKQAVTHKDLLPRRYRKLAIGDYVSARVERPRDVIDFFNKCIDAATDLDRLTSKELKIAEGEYSRSRLRALGDEWSRDYPNLLDYSRVLHSRPPSFKLRTVEQERLADLCLSLVAASPEEHGFIHEAAKRFVETDISFEDFRKMLVQTFFKVGLVGLKLLPHESAIWAEDRGRTVSSAEVHDDVSVVVKPMYYRALGIKDE